MAVAATLPSNGVKDVTTSMDVGNFIPGFTLSTTVPFVTNDDPLGIYFYSTADQATDTKDATLTVAADNVNLASFDLTAISLPEYPTGDGLDGSYLITITGYKLDGTTVVTTMHNQQKSLLWDVQPDFSAFTGITKFDVRMQAELYGGQWVFPVSNLTFDSFTIANAVPPNNNPPAFANPSTLALTAPQNGGTTFEGLLGVTDTDPGQTLTWSQNTAPAHGTLSFSGATASSGTGTVTPGGTITYTPAAGFAGTDTFTVQVSDGWATATRTVTVNVTPATPSAPDLAAASDNGISNTDNKTNAATLAFSGTGATGDSSSTVTVFIDKDGGGTNTAGDVTGTATMSNGAWTVSGLSTAGLADGSYNVYAVTSAGGVTGATSPALGIAIDRTAPTLVITSDKPALVAGETATITFTFSEDPGPSFTSGDVAVSGGSLGALFGTGTVRTAVFTPTSGTNGGTASIAVASGTYTDTAGNNGGAGASPSVHFDTAPPTLAIASSVPALKAGETAVITFTFSEDPGPSFTSGDVVVTGGTLGAISGTGAVRTAVFTPAANTDGGTATIAVPGGNYTDAAGNAGGAGTSPSLTFDTRAPSSPSTPSLAAGSDTGTATDDGLTKSATPTLSGTAEAGTTVKLYDGATLVGTGTADGGGNWSIATSALGEGDHSIAATAADAAGNVSAASGPLDVLVDTTPPTLAMSSDKAALKIGETTTVTFTFSEDPGSTFSWDGSNGGIVVSGGTLSAIAGTGLERTAVFTPDANADGTATINVDSASYTDAAGNAGGNSASLDIAFDTAAPELVILSDVSSLKIGETATITFVFSEDPGTSFAWDGTSGDVVASGGTLSAISGSGLVRTAVFTPNANTNGGTASITVAAGTYVDGAGNGGKAASTPSLTFDTLAPSAPSTPSLAAADDTGTSSSDHLTNQGAPTLSGTAEAGAAITLTDRINTLVGTGVADVNGNWSITTSLAGEGPHSIEAMATDAAGNSSSASGALVFTIDHTAPAVTLTSDKAALKIGDTATVTFTFSEDPGATFDANDVVVSGGTLGAISGTGNVRTAVFTPDAGTNAGVASITVDPGTYTDVAGNGGGAGATPGIVFDTQAPTLAITSDASLLKIGQSATITFTFSEDPGSFTVAEVVASHGVVSNLSGTGTVRTATFTPADSANNGTAVITVSGDFYTDAAGNSGSDASTTIGYDTLAPDVPAAFALAPASDTGALASDRLTNDTTPTFTGTAEDGATVTLYDGLTAVGSGVATGGVWSIATSALSDGDHAITAVATDAAGNSGTATPNLHVTIDATPPDAPGNLDLADSSDTGDSTSDNVTSDYTPTLTGTAEADSTVTLYDSDGTTVLGTATATGGVWSITSSTLGSGGHNLTAVATDAAGNASDPSAALSVTIEAPLTLSGGTRGDLLVGSAGDDTLDGGKGADTMVGGDGNDTFFVDNRGDTIVEAPGEGVDQVYAARSIVLAANVENVTLEGNGNSNATGNDLDNAIVGNAHNNVLTGGLGADTLTGGEGRDRFVYGSVADSPVGHPDVITDFNSAQRDRIDLRAIDANPLKSGNQAFTFIGSAAFSSTDATGQLRFDPTTHMLYGSTNADGAPEFAIELAGVTTLSARDFSL